MIAPQLTASEIAAVRAARSMTRRVYSGGSMVAMDGQHVLFRAGGEASFRELWRQALEIRNSLVA